MNTSFTLRVDQSALTALRNEFARDLQDVLNTAALRVEGDAKSRAPVDTGNLRNSIQAEPNAGQLEARVNVGAEYAAFVELGWSRRAAKPYLAPALLAEKPRLEKDVLQVMERAR